MLQRRVVGHPARRAEKSDRAGHEIGIFNSPGWSQSGGPWVKADQAMRYLASSETRAKGPQKFNAKLVQPTDSFQDVRVIAYPVPKDDQLTLNASNGTITSTPKVADLTKITDGDQKSGIAIPEGRRNYDRPESQRSVYGAQPDRKTHRAPVGRTRRVAS